MVVGASAPRVFVSLAYKIVPVAILGTSERPKNVPEPPVIPSEEVATSLYEPSDWPSNTWPYVGALNVPVPPEPMPSTPENAVAMIDPPLIDAPVIAPPEIVGLVIVVFAKLATFCKREI